MHGGADRELEDLLKELRKRGKKDFLLPLMSRIKYSKLVSKQAIVDN